MRSEPTSSKSILHLGCPARMFIASVCLTQEDLQRLGFLGGSAPTYVSKETAARTCAHRLAGSDPKLARIIDDLLDLRHLDLISEIRSRPLEELGDAVSEAARHATGERLAGWAWALLSDERPEISPLAGRLMGECYVRGMRSLVDGSAAHSVVRTESSQS